MSAIIRESRPKVNPLFDIFGDLFPDMITTQPVSKPMSNYWRDNDGYHIEIAAPGSPKDTFKIYFNDNVLLVERNIKESVLKDNTRIYRKEFMVDSFRETFPMSRDVDKDSVKATMDNGILRIDIVEKKDDDSKEKLIPIR
mgnify:CR=1 FL=1